MRSSKGTADERNILILRYLEAVRELRPKYIVFENVPGWLRTKHGKDYYDSLLEGLNELGYAFHADELDAADFGVPQFRKRVVLIASRDSHDIPYPEAMYGDPMSEGVKRRFDSYRSCPVDPGNKVIWKRPDNAYQAPGRPHASVDATSLTSSGGRGGRSRRSYT